MKNFLKTMGAVLCFCAVTMLLLPSTVQAGGIWAEIEVRFIVLDEYGSWEKCRTETEAGYKGRKAQITKPDGGLIDSTIDEVISETSYIRDENGEQKNVREEYSGNHRFFLASELNLHDMMPGTYTLTSFECPEGYEYDDAMEETYPLSVTLTEQDIEDYKEWAAPLDFADGKVWEINVPVKKIGTVSAALQKPSKKPELVLEDTYIYTEGYGSYGVEYQYATEKDGSYQTLSSEDSSYYFYNSPLKHGKTYYFRARYYKTVGGEKLYGDFGKVLKAKVCKSDVSKMQPVLQKVGGKKNGTAEKLRVSDGIYMIRLSYAAKKKGKYKEINQTFAVGEEIDISSLSSITSMKKGKTYYIRARFLDDETNEKIYSAYSKPVKIKM